MGSNQNGVHHIFTVKFCIKKKGTTRSFLPKLVVGFMFRMEKSHFPPNLICGFGGYTMEFIYLLFVDILFGGVGSYLTIPPQVVSPFGGDFNQL